MEQAMKLTQDLYNDVCREHARRLKKDNISLSQRLRNTFNKAASVRLEYNDATGVLAVMTKSGIVVNELACTPVVQNTAILVHPIKAGIFIPNRCEFMANLNKYNYLRNQVVNWEQVRVVGYFGAQKTKDGRVVISYTFCQPEDYIFSRYRFDKKVSLTLLRNKMMHVQEVEQVRVRDGKITNAFIISPWMHNMTIAYFDKYTGEECCYLFNKSVNVQYMYFVDRCISYFKIGDN